MSITSAAGAASAARARRGRERIESMLGNSLAGVQSLSEEYQSSSRFLYCHLGVYPGRHVCSEQDYTSRFNVFVGKPKTNGEWYFANLVRRRNEI